FSEDFETPLQLESFYARFDTNGVLMKRELARGELLFERDLKELEQLRRSDFDEGFRLSELKGLSLSKKMPALRKKRIAEATEVAARIVRGTPYRGLLYQRPYLNNDARLW